MARHRQPPECPFCGKVIAKAKYRDQSNLPIQLQLIGDTFEGWAYEDHECEEMKIFRKRKEAKDFLNENGYGKGTNYTTDLVVGLMVRFSESQQQKEDGNSKNLNT